MSEQKPTRRVPLAPEELIQISERVEEIAQNIGIPEVMDDWRWGVRVDIYVEDDVVGYVKMHGDGWLGFYPLPIEED